jgi:hypothetical protein
LETCLQIPLFSNSRSRHQVCKVEKYSDGPSELHAQRPADHEVDAAALDGAVGRDGADGEHGRHQDRVGDAKLNQGAEETRVAHDVADAEEEDRAQHGEGNRSKNACKDRC